MTAVILEKAQHQTKNTAEGSTRSSQAAAYSHPLWPLQLNQCRLDQIGSWPDVGIPFTGKSMCLEPPLPLNGMYGTSPYGPLRLQDRNRC